MVKIAADNFIERDVIYCTQFKAFVNVSPRKCMELVSLAVVLNGMVCVFSLFSFRAFVVIHHSASTRPAAVVASRNKSSDDAILRKLVSSAYLYMHVL